jgi:hypothetical protein
MESEVELVYLAESDVDTPKYSSFFERYHGPYSFFKWKAKIHWYFHCGGFKLLVAKLDNEYVGQSCAYRAEAVVDGKRLDLWWGVDVFVLANMRGKSIGKKMQRKLHEDLPNFTSVSYAKLNGIIKRKVGATELLDVKFTYYPISAYFSLFFDLAVKKISKSFRIPRIRLPYFYPLGRMKDKMMQGLTVDFIDRGNICELSEFMEKCLCGEKFHIVRSKEFLKWKYIDNPNISFRIVSVSDKGQRIGCAVLSEVYEGSYVVTKARLVKVLDCMVLSGCGLSHKQLLMIAINKCRQYWKMAPDGILDIHASESMLSITYPSVTHMLSNIKCQKLKSGYVSYIDQDMERMY